MSFQRMTTIGSIPLANSEATASRDSRSPSFSSRWISIRLTDSSCPARSAPSASVTCSVDATRTSAIATACSIGASIAYRPQVVGGLLGVVDDVVEPRGQVVDVGRLERRPLAGALMQSVDDVVGDAVALPLAYQHVARQLRPLRVVSNHLAQQGARAMGIAARLLEEGEDLVVVPPRQPSHLRADTRTGPRPE